MIKRVFGMLLTLTMLFCVPLTVYAHDMPQERNDCSIELIVRYDGEDINTGTLTAIKVGYVDKEDWNFFFSQEMTGVRLDDVTSPDAPAVQKAFYDKNKNSFDFYTQTQNVSNGKATFTGLSTGLYLIVQDKAADGFNKLGEFLVSVPYLDNGELQYQVTAQLKSELEREPEATDPLPTEPEATDPSPTEPDATDPSPTDPEATDPPQTEPDATDPPPTEPDGPKLPQTGQLNWPVPILAVSGMLLFGLGCMLCIDGRRKAGSDSEQ